MLFEPQHLPANIAREGSHKYLSVPEFKMTFGYKQKASERIQFIQSRDIAAFIRTIFKEDTIDWYESFIIVALNRANKVISYSVISQGGLTGTVADPRMIMQFALAMNACSLILAHNHPSGSLKPSRADEDLTKKISEAAAYFDIRVLDHIIVTGEGYYSFADEGLI